MNNIVSLVGQPNVGKTTIFNKLTGMSQTVGNWPGVTVEKKEGSFKYKDKTFKVVDLPGIYTLMSNSLDQKITRDFLLNNREGITVNVIDTPNINRNLYLTLQLLELGIKPILCLNLIDEAERHGMNIDYEEIKRRLNLPVVKVSGRYGVGLDELKEKIYNYNPKNYGVEIKYSETLEDGIKKIENNIKNENINFPDKFKSVPHRWFAISLLEGDPEVWEIFSKYDNIVKIVNNVKNEIENKILHDVESYVVEERYKKCDEILKGVISSYQVFDDIDTIILHPVYGYVIFAIVLYLMYSFVFSLGDFFSSYIRIIFDIIGNYLASILSPPYSGFIVDGVIRGVGGVLEFFPQVFLIMLSLSILENCGYMARVAALMNDTMSKIGLSGKAFIPLMIGFGCSVPAVLSTRIISNHKDRLISILITPLIPCSARFVILGFMATAFFANYQEIFTIGVLGILFLILMSVSYILSKFIKGESEEFIFELPPYRIPDWDTILKITWDRSKSFLKKAGTVIVAGSLLFYYLTNYPSVDNSYSFLIGKILENFTQFMGIDWHGAVSLLFGIIAKELVVSTLSIVYGDNLTNIFTPLTAFVFTLVSMIYIPCLATVAAQYSETGSLKWTLFAIVYNILLASIVGIIVYNIGRLLGF